MAGDRKRCKGDGVVERCGKRQTMKLTPASRPTDCVKFSGGPCYCMPNGKGAWIWTGIAIQTYGGTSGPSLCMEHDEAGEYLDLEEINAFRTESLSRPATVRFVVSTFPDTDPYDDKTKPDKDMRPVASGMMDVIQDDTAFVPYASVYRIPPSLNHRE
ncbi:hypothetical protein ASPBRDRAFT_27175 [Aspergillus brasiliensis CBS 101740]|uniref:Uncharacterized protein n=1 Tax=Aspergillus brasiliensis (strain CBS 101740 / IMI 381727 / IBT 21946) TaxID=767769 RepID=A0A1L9URH6_ASPBC|nr:hypothetical protein ASPBRDRAFT_27175 [Aspergillus brasiliensis CBS 101740]